MGEIMRIADSVNERFDLAKPWELAKDSSRRGELQDVCSDALNAFRALTYYLAPVLPQVADRAAAMFGLSLPLRWDEIEQVATSIRPYQHLMTRIDPKKIDALLEGPPSRTASTPQPSTAAAGEGVAQISIDDFAKIDLRIARIVNAEQVEGADK